MRGVVVYLGLALAGALFALGVRELKINRKRKCGLFISTVLMALYLLGARYAGAAEPAKSVRETTLTQKDQMQIAELVKTKEWQNFKAFWQKLDIIEPKKDRAKIDKERINYEGEYPGTINSEKTQELRQELEILIVGLEQVEKKGMIGPVEKELLARICFERIEYMLAGFKSYFMRMIPSPTLTSKEISIKNLEIRIDALLLLKRREKINKEEYKQALDNIEEEIRRFSIVHALNLYYIYDRFSRNLNINETMNTRNVQDYLVSLEKDYRNHQDSRKKDKISADDKYEREIDAAYEKSKRALEELKPVLPLMNELIADLEQR